MFIFLSLACVAFLFVRRVEDCHQINSHAVQLRAGAIAGTVTLNGKPLDGAVLHLHKLLRAYSIEIGHADAHVLGETTTARDGSFSFGEVPSGKYVVFMLRPAGEFTDVELVKPKHGESDTIAIEYSADWCGSATAISANGERRRPRSMPTIPNGEAAN